MATDLVNLDALEQDAIAVCNRIESALAAADGSSEVMEIRDDAERMAVLARIRGLNRVSVRLTNAVRRAEIKWARITPKSVGGRPAEENLGIDSEVFLPNADQRKAYRAAAEIDDAKLDDLMAAAEESGEPLTRKAVIEAAKGKGNQFVNFSTGEESWYTPEEYIEAARTALGGIGLDPASTDDAQGVVQAEVYYTADDDGLAQDWRADSIFLNPPFNHKKINAFSDKLLNAYHAGRVKRAIWLARNATETRWFQQLSAEAAAVFFPQRRIVYWRKDADGDVVRSCGMTGDVLIYLGDDAPRFHAAFAGIGGCFMAVTQSTAGEDE